MVALYQRSGAQGSFHKSKQTVTWTGPITLPLLLTWEVIMDPDISAIPLIANVTISHINGIIMPYGKSAANEIYCTTL